jgi:hypothetical protein
MKSIKSAVLTVLLLCGSGTLAHALIAYTLTTYQFESASGQPTIFDGSTVTLGVPSVNSADRVFGFDIKDPNALGGEVISDPTLGNLVSMNISSVSPSGWTGSFAIDYTKALGGTGTITVAGTDPTGNITDHDPVMANGIWTAVSVPDQANTMLLLGLMIAALGAIRSIQTGAVKRLRLAAFKALTITRSMV